MQLFSLLVVVALTAAMASPASERCGFHCRAASQTELPVSLLQTGSQISAMLGAGRVRSSLGQEDLVDYTDHHSEAVFEGDDNTLLELAAEIKKDDFLSLLKSLVESSRAPSDAGGDLAPPSRFVGSKGNALSAKFIEEHFAAAGLSASQQPLDPSDPRIAKYLGQGAGAADSLLEVGAPTGGNVLGFLEGTDLKHEVVALCSHYDSVNWENIRDAAPGVDDNGSGSALVMLAAKTLGERAKAGTFKPRRSILFATFNAEEEGLVGSSQFVNWIQKPEQKAKFGDVKKAIVVDEVAYPGRPGFEKQAIFETKGAVDGTEQLVDTLAKTSDLENGQKGFSLVARGVNGNATGEVRPSFLESAKRRTDRVSGYKVNYHGFGSDHMSFLDSGIPAVLLIERDDEYHSDTWGHSARDTFEHIDPEFGAAMTRLAIRSVVRLASPKKI